MGVGSRRNAGSSGGRRRDRNFGSFGRVRRVALPRANPSAPVKLQ